MARKSSSKSEYREKFKDPRWQRKRLEILERDAFVCQFCQDTQTTLHVHHRWYELGKEPWDYPNSCFITLCADCHEMETSDARYAYEDLRQALSLIFYAEEIFHLIEAIMRLREASLSHEDLSIYLELIKQPEMLLRFYKDNEDVQELLGEGVCLRKKPRYGAGE